MKATLAGYLRVLRWGRRPARWCRTGRGPWLARCGCPFSAAMCGLDHICGICREIIC